MTWLHVARSDTPLLLAFPHGGTDLAGEGDGFRSHWWALRDTDWHIRRLYDGLVDATYVSTDVSRSVIDCNRDPSGQSLYPGQATTGLCPSETFDGDPLYRDGGAPDVPSRLARWFTPYHAALESEIVRLRARHRNVVLIDCHSIRSRIPRLFDGDLPEFNIGTDGGRTCAPGLEAAVVEACRARDHVLNGRFRGGWTTRHYGRPADGVHALQLEIAMRAYLDEPLSSLGAGNWPPAWDAARAEPVRNDLHRILTAANSFAKGR
jgi:formiminoglutamase